MSVVTGTVTLKIDRSLLLAVGPVMMSMRHDRVCTTVYFTANSYLASLAASDYSYCHYFRQHCSSWYSLQCCTTNASCCIAYISLPFLLRQQHTTSSGSPRRLKGCPFGNDKPLWLCKWSHALLAISCLCLLTDTPASSIQRNNQLGARGKRCCLTKIRTLRYKFMIVRSRSNAATAHAGRDHHEIINKALNVLRPCYLARPGAHHVFLFLPLKITVSLVRVRAVAASTSSTRGLPR
jgi:hypothetical protein